MPAPDPNEVIDLTVSSEPSEAGDIDRLTTTTTTTTRTTRNGPRTDASSSGAPAEAHPSKRRSRRKRKAGGEGEEDERPEDGRARDRTRTRSNGREQAESEPAKKRKKKKSRPENASSRSSPAPDTSQPTESGLDGGLLFFIDTAPAAVPDAVTFHPQASTSATKDAPESTPALLLPAHVSVLENADGAPIEIIRPPDSDSDSESFIEYLDYDDRATAALRYFDDQTEDAKKQARFVCKNCGAENEHKTFECPVQICLTCGARDEHSTRGCPISKTCFSCGMKGHINKTCPNRNSGMGQYDDCDRCGSRKHTTNGCPTLWRLYEYVTDAERKTILQARDEKQSLALGQGGEGYIARDEWCYNCGGPDHLGDDCTNVPFGHNAPQEPSAFGSYNTMSGPFYDVADTDTTSTRPRPPREWEAGHSLPDGWGFNAPANVGRKGRAKDRVRMEERAREVEEMDDPDDWFGNARNARNRGTAAPPKPPPPHQSRNQRNGSGHGREAPKTTIRFGGGRDGSRHGQDDGRRQHDDRRHRDGGGGGGGGGGSRGDYDRKQKPSLLNRIQEPGTSELRIRGSAGRTQDSGRDGHGQGGHADRREPAREWDRGRGRDEGGSGPRYRGGYTR
ncbi:hypothetical protein OF83DRAFT_628622 [Amylostereum chailletii]|nr:hypothetical protein OF83DRAFT_628622 [Amylostereum chailletii]